MRFRFEPEARIELAESVRHYEKQRRGAGLRFITAVHRAAQKAGEHPRRYKLDSENCRRIGVSRYPYWLIFRIDQAANDEPITIVAVVHHRRLPDYWISRIH